MTAPLVVEVTRGSVVESRHDVDLILVDARGQVEEVRGDPQGLVYPRSALKPIQATPLLTTGAAQAMGLGAAELALACASHGGEHEHVTLVEDWLTRHGYSARDLECGAHRPLTLSAADDLVRSGREPDARHNCCSGKHTGFLTVAAFLGIDPTGYISPGHPIQTDHVDPAIEDFCRVRLDGSEPGIDGCGIPTHPIPLAALATGWAQLGQRGAGRELLDAMVSHPHLVAGTGHADTTLMQEAAGRAAVKHGAEGVHCGVDRRDGRAFALKARDGANRAAAAAAAWVLDRWGAIEHAAPTPVLNRAGTQVGEIRVARS
jgi:L-asparaginase II